MYELKQINGKEVYNCPHVS